MVAKQVWLLVLGKNALQPVEGLKQGVEVGLVSLLAGREPGLVHAVVDGIVHPLVHPLNLAPQSLGEDAAALLLLCALAQVLREEVVELGIEHADDLGALVVHHGVRLLVPKHRNGVAALEVRVGVLVQLLDLGEARVQRVLRGTVLPAKDPALWAHVHAKEVQVNNRVKALQLAHDERAVRPGAARRQIQRITVCFWRVSGAGSFGNKVSERARWPGEVTVLLVGLVDVS